MRLVRIPAIPRVWCGAVMAALSTILLVAPTATATPAAPPRFAQPLYAPQSADACADSEEVAFLALINDYRAASGVRPLSISSSLSSESAYHSVDMAVNG